MKKTAMLLTLSLFFTMSAFAQDNIEVTSNEKEVISEQLEKEANQQEDSKTREFLKKIAKVFKDSKNSLEVEIDKAKEDCYNCSKEEKTKNIFKTIGRKLGKGASWISVKTGKPFMTAGGFIRGLVEKGDKNKEVVALYQFFLNHQEEFDKLYLEAGTPDEMMELMLAKMEDIMEAKTRIIMKDFLVHVGINKEIPADLSSFELTAEEIGQIDLTKIDPAFINHHPEYLEVKPLIGEMTKAELMDIVTSGYFNKAISFENYKEALPHPAELVGTVVAQIFAPKIALGVISSTLAGLYATPVIAADIGTGISASICLQKENQEKFKTDEDLKMFCSYVTNRSAYELLQGRARGYVSGKKAHKKLFKKVDEIRARRAEKRKEKEQARLQLH